VENQLQQAISETRCELCERFWLGKFFGEPFCNNCLEREAAALLMEGNNNDD
jgi:hypothetical protein